MFRMYAYLIGLCKDVWNCHYSYLQYRIYALVLTGHEKNVWILTVFSRISVFSIQKFESYLSNFLKYSENINNIFHQTFIAKIQTWEKCVAFHCKFC